MAGFSLVSDADSTVYRVVRVASQAYTIGDAVMLDRTADAVDVVPATASSNSTNIFGVAMQTVTSAATELIIALVTPRQLWSVVSVSNTAATNDNYQRMLLANKSQVNNTHTDNTTDEAVFTQTGIISTSAIVGRFNAVAGVTA